MNPFKTLFINLFPLICFLFGMAFGKSNERGFLIFSFIFMIIFIMMDPVFKKEVQE